MVGRGGATSADFVLLKALRSEAKDDFFVNGEVAVVATDDCAECAKGALNFREEMLCVE